VALGVVAQHAERQDRGRGYEEGVGPGHHIAGGLVHLAPALELDELIGHGIRGLGAIDLPAEPDTAVVRASGGRVVLAEGLAGHPEQLPLGRPFHPPGHLALAFPNVRIALVAAPALEVNVGELVADDPVGERPALRAFRAEGPEAVRHLPPGDLSEDGRHLGPFPEDEVHDLREPALLVQPVGPDDPRPYAQLPYGVQEGRDVVLGIAGMAAVRAGDVADRLPDLLLEALRKEGIALAQGIVGIDEIDEIDIRLPLLQRLVDGVGGYGLPQAAHVNVARGGDAS